MYDHGSLTKGYFSTKGEIPNIDDDRVKFIKGFFNEKKDEIQNELKKSINTKLVHFDADIYSSTLFTFNHIFNSLNIGFLRLYLISLFVLAKYFKYFIFPCLIASFLKTPIILNSLWVPNTKYAYLNSASLIFACFL